MTALFWILTPEDQAKLMEWQFNTYGYHLTIPPDPFKPVSLNNKLESLEEIDRELRKPPSRSRG